MEETEGDFGRVRVACNFKRTWLSILWLRIQATCRARKRGAKGRDSLISSDQQPDQLLEANRITVNVGATSLAARLAAMLALGTCFASINAAFGSPLSSGLTESGRYVATCPSLDLGGRYGSRQVGRVICD